MPENFNDSQFQFQQAILVAKLEEQIIALAAKVEEGETKIKALELERDRAFRWGIFLLGSSVLTLGSWILKIVTGGKIPV
jgi:hypothetical protein